MKKHSVPIKLSHSDKILFPDLGLTKEMLAEYYNSIADWILPYVIKRPLTLLRCPDGVNEKCFYQKHAVDDLPGLYSILISEKTKNANYVYIKNLSGLLALIQLNVLEIHLWACHIDKIEKPDHLVFDLDPDPQLSWNKIVETANLVREHLQQVKLESFIKTSGGKGLHIVVPIRRTATWEEAKLFSQAFAQSFAEAYPKMVTANMSKSQRRGKIFLDYLRNVRGSTTVAPYSLRARPNASVSMPVEWSELPKIKADLFTIQNSINRLIHLKSDPWAAFLKLKQKLPAY